MTRTKNDYQLRIVFFLIIVSFAIILFQIFNHNVEDKYMDEIFHIPQLQAYWHTLKERNSLLQSLSSTAWDEKITTFPGLYWFTLIYCKIVSKMAHIHPKILPRDWGCEAQVSTIRFFNVIVYFVLVAMYIFRSNRLLPTRSIQCSNNYVIGAESSEFRSKNLSPNDNHGIEIESNLHRSTVTKEDGTLWMNRRRMLGHLNVQEDKKKLRPELRPLDKPSSNWRFEEMVEKLPFILFPFSYFFVYMYYTDLLSLLFFLLAYHFRRSVFGLACVLMRQSNIMWVFYLGWLQVYEDSLSCTENRSDFFTYVTRNMTQIISRYFSWILIGVSFVIFVWKNGSIVLGDKANHEVSFHFNQLCYFVAFTCAMLPGHILVFLTKVPSQLSIRYRRPHTKWNLIARDILLFTIGSLILGYLNFRFAFVHPFILSDNRHYIFYLWRKLFHIQDMSANTYRFRNALYSPVFLLCFIFLNQLLRTQTRLWRALFLLTVSMNLMLAPLVEFRYFIIPFYIVLEHISCRPDTHTPRQNSSWNKDTPSISPIQWLGVSKHEDNLAATINTLYYIAINVLVFYIFMKRPFGENLTSRFMF